LTLAEGGAQVTVVAGAPGASALGGGCLDAAAASPGVVALPWRDPLRGSALTPRERLVFLLRENPAHPYAALFGGPEAAAAALERATAALRGWLAPAGLRVAGSLDDAPVFANVPGTLRVADFALSGVAGGDLRGAREIGVVDAPGLEGYDGPTLARALAHELASLGVSRAPVRVVHLRWNELFADEPKPARIAARLDEPEAAEAFAKALSGAGPDDGVLLLPPLLGLATTEALSGRLAQAAGARVAEAVGFAPHALAGYRLDRALRAALAAHGVRVKGGRASRVGAAAASGAALAVELAAASGQAVEGLDADALVLATGRFVGGGLVSGSREVHEPFFDLPLFDADGRRVDGIPAHRSVRKGYANTQPLYAAGVRVDARARPLAANGAPRHARLFAAGDLLGGFDPARERTGLGVALASGVAAGASALAELRS
jgi:glycerol-3-phosphate dehydrogenase subunit B